MKRERYVWARDLIQRRSAASRKEGFKASPTQRKTSFREKINDAYVTRAAIAWYSRPLRPGSYTCHVCIDGVYYRLEELPEEQQREIYAYFNVPYPE